MTTQRGIRVLIAEDESMVAEMLHGMLEDIGHQVVGKATDGRQAVEMAQSIQPDVILMDIEMPNLNGLEAARLIYEVCPTPVVVLTAYDNPDLVEQASQAGVGAYLVKPLDVRTLDRAMTIALARFTEMIKLRDYTQVLEQRVRERTAQLQAQAARLEAILGSVGDAIAMADLEMQVQYVNRAFTRLTGYSAAEAYGQQVNALIGDRLSDQIRQSLRIVMTKGETWRGEVTARRKDGRNYEAALVIAPVRNADGQLMGFASSHRDISQRRALERAQNQFLTSISHELRTPVTNMKLYTQLLQKGMPPEKIERYLEVLEGQVDRLSHLTQDILAITALDSGRAVQAWEPVSLAAIVDGAVGSHFHQAEAGDLTLEVVRPFPPDLPSVYGDQVRLCEALTEVVENAVIFTPPGGQVTVEVTSVKDADWRWVTISVRDTGPGIPPEEQASVFDRFYRGELAKSGHIPGTGLGLSLAHEVLMAHGGRIVLESPANSPTGPTKSQEEPEPPGAVFTLWLRGAEE